MQLLLSIDIESASGDYNRDVFADGYGLPYLLDSLSRHGLKATFFVEAMDGTRSNSTRLAETCRSILTASQEVQLHLHPEIANLAGIRNTDGVLWRQTWAEQTRLIATGRDILTAITGTTPNAFRAGSLTANTDTLLAMIDCGFLLGSNRDLDTHSSIESRLNDVFPVVNDLSSYGGVIDVPVTAFRSPFPRLDGQWRHLEPCALSLGEMTCALKHMSRAGYQSACLLTHTHEFYYRRNNRFHINHINRRRWEGLLRFIKHAPWADITSFSNLESPMTLPTHSPPPLKLSPFWSLYRLAEQGIKRLHGVGR